MVHVAQPGFRQHFVKKDESRVNMFELLSIWKIKGCSCVNCSLTTLKYIHRSSSLARQNVINPNV